MKKIPLLILPLLVGLDGVGLAQGQSRDEAMVRSLDDQERIAALKKDTKALERLWSDQFVGNQPNNKVVADKRALMDALVPRSSYVRQIEFFRVDGDFAFIMGLETIVAATDAPGVGLVAGQPTRRRFTQCLEERRRHLASLCTSCQRHCRSLTIVPGRDVRMEAGELFSCRMAGPRTSGRAALRWRARASRWAA